MPVISKAQQAAMNASRAAAVEQMTARLGEMAPGPGQFAVTIRIDRPDGQFVTSTRLVPADLMSRPDPDFEREVEAIGVARGFVSAYQRAAELPE